MSIKAQFRFSGMLVILSGFLLALAAILNYFQGVELAGGLAYFLSYLTLGLSIFALYAAQAEQCGLTGFLGFVLTSLGSTLAVIPAFLILGQLAGAIETNDALMASWVDIPLGRLGIYMLVAGLGLFGIGTSRGGVFPAWAGWLVTAGIALYLPTEFFGGLLFQVFWPVGATLLGLGLARMGIQLLAGIKNSERR